MIKANDCSSCTLSAGNVAVMLVHYRITLKGVLEKYQEKEQKTYECDIIYGRVSHIEMSLAEHI